MRGANITAAIAAMLWLLMLLGGHAGVGSVVGQHVLGYPNRGQIDYYIMVPCAVLLALGFTCWVCNALRRWPQFLVLAALASLLALCPYLLFYGGGV